MFQLYLRQSTEHKNIQLPPLTEKRISEKRVTHNSKKDANIQIYRGTIEYITLAPNPQKKQTTYRKTAPMFWTKNLTQLSKTSKNTGI